MNTQDFALQSNLGGGPIEPRWLEALGSTDHAIQAARQLLLDAADNVKEGKALVGTNPEDYRTVRAGEMLIPGSVSWRDATKEIVEANW